MNEAQAFQKVAWELEKAEQEFPAFNSCHEGKAVIEEELDELWDEIKKKKKNMACIEKEAIQVAAMGIRFLINLC